MGAKSILGMMPGNGPWYPAPIQPGTAMDLIVSIAGGSYLGDLLGDRSAYEEYAYPGRQDLADAFRTDTLFPYIEPSYGQGPGYVYDQHYWGKVNNWYTGVAGTISRPCIRVTTNVGNERMVPTTVTFYKNGSPTDVVITVPAFQTGVFLGTGTMSLDVGDYVYARIESIAQDVNDPDYIGETIEISAMTVTYEVAGAGAYIPYRTPVTAGQMAATPTPPSSWPADPNDLPNDLGWQVSGSTGVIYTQRTDDVLNYSHYAFVPMVMIAEGAYAQTQLQTSWSEAEARRVSQSKIRAPGTFSNMGALIFETNGSTETGFGSVWVEYDLVLEVNGVDTVSSPIPFNDYAGVTYIEDPKAVADGDLVNYSITVTTEGDKGGNGLTSFRSDFVSNDEWFDLHAHGYYNSGSAFTYENYSAAAPVLTEETYWALIAGSDQFNADSFGLNREYYEFPLTQRMEFKNLRCQVGYISGGSIRIGLMIDGVKQTQYVDVMDGEPGWYEDTLRTDFGGDCAGDIKLAVYYVEVLSGSPRVRFDCFEITARVVLADECGGGEEEEEDCPARRTCPEGLNLSKLIPRTFRMLGEDPAAPVYWTEAEVIRNINDSYTDICKRTKSVELIEAVELSADNELGDLSSQVGQIFRVTFDDRKLLNSTKYELDATQPYWETQSGYIERYFTVQEDNRKIGTFQMWDGSRYNAWNTFIDGAYVYSDWTTATAYVYGDRVTIAVDGVTHGYVCIEGHTSGTTSEPGVGTAWETYWVPLSLVVWAVRNPPPLVDGGCEEEPYLPPWSHLAIAFGAAARCLRRQGEQRNMAMAQAYETLVGQYEDLLKAYIANRLPQKITVAGRSGLSAFVRKPMPWDTPVEEN